MQITRFIVFALILSIASTTRASVLYGYGQTNQFHTINQSTGFSSPVGFTFNNPSSVIDLAGDWQTGSERIWAVSSGSPRAMYRMGLNFSGGATLVGTFPFSSPTRTMRTLAFDAVTQKLYGTSGDTIVPTEPTLLYEINPTTAAMTLIGDVGFDTVTALGFDLNGTLFGVSSSNSQSRLIEINTTTGAGALRSTLGIFPITDLAARPEDGTMLAAVNTTIPALYSLDTTTGAAQHLTDVGPIFSWQGIAFAPEPSAVAALAALLTLPLRRNR